MIRRDPDITKKKENTLSQKRADYEACREIATLKNHPGWERVREIVKNNMERCVYGREDFQKLSDEGLRFILKEEQDLKFFLGIVDDVDKTMEQLNAEIAELTNDINERKHNAPTASGTTPRV